MPSKFAYAVTLLWFQSINDRPYNRVVGSKIHILVHEYVTLRFTRIGGIGIVMYFGIVTYFVRCAAFLHSEPIQHAILVHVKQIIWFLLSMAFKQIAG